MNGEPVILLMGQTPPPWHGQAVATQILFDHEWPGFEIHRLRMEFSEEMHEVGRFQWKKIVHLFSLIREARSILTDHPGCLLFYPPASAKWVPFLRDVMFLSAVRHLAGSTVFIFHASGLPVFTNQGPFRRMMAKFAYQRADMALEVAREALPPHEMFDASTWEWSPCAIDVPDLERHPRPHGSAFTALFVGSLQEGKGVLEIIRTAALLKEQGRESEFRFRIVGKWFSEDFRREITNQCSVQNLESMVELVGQLTGDEKWQAYSKADVFFFPTHYASEATPIVLMEALGAGLPIISTEWAGIPAMLKGCETARLLPVRSPKQYAEAIADLRDNQKDTADTARLSRSFYREHFLPARFIERVNRVFLEVAKPALLGSPSTRPQGLENHALARSGMQISAYLADQNPGYDRSFGISRMSQVILEALQATGQATIETIASRTSQQAPIGINNSRILPWGTRRKSIRLLTDHFHPMFGQRVTEPDLYYYPKGYLPLLSALCRPSVVTIHDTIIQYDEDRYPNWRHPWEYKYWAMMLKHTLRNADRILTVSESSRSQIDDFMARHRLPEKPIDVTFEPCLYESLPQPQDPGKMDYVIHLASCEPHKRTGHLIDWWHQAETQGRSLPQLHLIGNVPPESACLISSSSSIIKRPFLEDHALQAAYSAARALILPSEIEGFGLPALEAYYLGTPVCFVRDTSVDEILSAATTKGGFVLDDADSLFDALDEVCRMDASEVRECGLILRDTYASTKVAHRMLKAFRHVLTE